MTTIPGSMAPIRPAEAIALLLLAAAATLFASRPIWNIDIFWHMAAGDHFLTHAALPIHDIFSAIDPERSWVTFQWGYEVLVHLLDTVGGLGLVRAVHALVLVGALAVLWWGCRGRLRMGPWASFTLTLLVLVLFGDRIRARPHIFNLLGWAVALPWLALGPRRLGRSACVGIAVTMGLWANLHAGGALVFLIAAGTLPAGALIAKWTGRDDDPQDTPRALTWYASALLPALASPLFVRGNLQALTTFSAHQGTIGEWQPSWHFLEFVTLDRLGTSGLAHTLCATAPTLAGLALLWALWRSRLRSDHGEEQGQTAPTASTLQPWRALLALALVVLAHRSVRFVYVAAFALVVLAPVVTSWADRAIAPRRWVTALCIAVLGFAAYGFNIGAQHSSVATAAERAFTGPHLDERRYPIEAADFLASTGFEGNIFCQTNWGGYLLWRLGPGVKVIADGRANFSAQVSADLAYAYDRSNLADPDAGPQRAEIYGRYPVDAIVHQHPVWPPGYAPDPRGFLRVFGDHRGEVWLRNTPRTTTYLERLEATREGGQ